MSAISLPRLTGCDTTSKFFGCGNTTAWNDSDGGIVVVVSDGVVIFRGGLDQLHRFGTRTQLMHAPRVSSVIRKGLPIPVIIMKTLHFIQKLRLWATCLLGVAS